MPPAARILDNHVCPQVTVLVPHVGGPIVVGCPTVMIGFMPAARITDMLVCVGPPDMIAMGSPTVMIGGLPAARIGDMTIHGGVVVMGCPTVMIGEMGMGSLGMPSLPSLGVPVLPGVPSTSPPGAPTPSTPGGGSTGPMEAGKLAQTNPKYDNLPDKISFPKSVSDDMNKLWGQSFDKDGNSQEQGGVFAIDPKGNLVLLNQSDGKSGNSGSFTPNTKVPDGYTYVGTFHTHPYGKNDGTWNGANLPFSGGDLGTLDDYHEKISGNQSGDNVYVLVPTDKTPASLPDNEVQKKYDSSFNDEYKKQKDAGKSDPDAASAAGEKATADVAKAYNLGYYKGKNGGDLQRINP